MFCIVCHRSSVSLALHHVLNFHFLKVLGTLVFSAFQLVDDVDPAVAIMRPASTCLLLQLSLLSITPTLIWALDKPAHM